MITSVLSGRSGCLNVGKYAVCLLFMTISLSRTLAAGSQNFFPSGVFDPDNVKIDSLRARWYSEELTLLQEQSLFEARRDPNLQSYRFMWLRSFNRPILIRVEIHSDGSGVLVTKMADGRRSQPPSNLILNRTETVTPETVKQLLNQLQRVNYWTLAGPDTNSSGRDGAQWVIEGIEHGKYHLVDRWSPMDGPVRDLGLYFLRELSHLQLSAAEIY